MKMLGKMLLITAALTVWAAPLHAQSLAEQKKAQNKLLAYRAARADAIRKLAERIQGLQISSETTVKDFVTESDTIRTAMDAFLSGMKEVDKKWMEDGTCEVTLEVTLQDLVVNLKQIHNRYYKGNKVKIEDFEKLTITPGEIKVLRETGMGAPRPDTSGDWAEVREDSLESLSYLSGAAKAFWLAHVQPQGRLMAVRAARVDGMRRLAERIKGLNITSETYVRDFVAESDEIRTVMNTFLRGAKEVGINYHSDELIVEVEMQVTLRTVIANIKSYAETHYKGDTVKMKALEEVALRSEDKVIRETGMGVPPAKYLKGVQISQAVEMTLQNQWPPAMRSTGNAAIAASDNPAQAKLMAFRAAELDARRKMAEELQGLMIGSKTTVRDFVAESDEIRTAMLTFQQGVGVVDGSQKVFEDGTVEVTVEADLRPLWDTVIFYQKKLNITIQ